MGVVGQPDGHLLRVSYVPNTYRYAVLPHNADVLVWDTAAGAELHIAGGIISVENAGYVDISDHAIGTIIARLHFNEKKAVPIPIVEDLVLAVGNVLRARYIADAGTPNGYITVIGHEH